MAKPFPSDGRLIDEAWREGQKKVFKNQEKRELGRVKKGLARPEKLAIFEP